MKQAQTNCRPEQQLFDVVVSSMTMTASARAISTESAYVMAWAAGRTFSPELLPLPTSWRLWFDLLPLLSTMGPGHYASWPWSCCSPPSHRILRVGLGTPGELMYFLWVKNSTGSAYTAATTHPHQAAVRRDPVDIREKVGQFASSGREYRLINCVVADGR